MSKSSNEEVDMEFPGTAVKRLKSVHARVATLTENDLSCDWEDVRRKILWAGGLEDLPDAVPGQVSVYKMIFLRIFTMGKSFGYIYISYIYH